MRRLVAKQVPEHRAEAGYHHDGDGGQNVMVEVGNFTAEPITEQCYQSRPHNIANRIKQKERWPGHFGHASHHRRKRPDKRNKMRQQHRFAAKPLVKLFSSLYVLLAKYDAVLFAEYFWPQQPANGVAGIVTEDGRKAYNGDG